MLRVIAASVSALAIGVHAASHEAADDGAAPERTATPLPEEIVVEYKMVQTTTVALPAAAIMSTIVPQMVAGIGQVMQIPADQLGEATSEDLGTEGDAKVVSSVWQITMKTEEDVQAVQDFTTKPEVQQVFIDGVIAAAKGMGLEATIKAEFSVESWAGGDVPAADKNWVMVALGKTELPKSVAVEYKMVQKTEVALPAAAIMSTIVPQMVGGIAQVMGISAAQFGEATSEDLGTDGDAKVISSVWTITMNSEEDVKAVQDFTTKADTQQVFIDGVIAAAKGMGLEAAITAEFSVESWDGASAPAADKDWVKIANGKAAEEEAAAAAAAAATTTKPEDSESGAAMTSLLGMLVGAASFWTLF